MSTRVRSFISSTIYKHKNSGWIKNLKNVISKLGMTESEEEFSITPWKIILLYWFDFY